MKEPLAQRLRPRTLDEVCGQRHLLAPGQVFRRTIDRGVIPNMIFYGPSGVDVYKRQGWGRPRTSLPGCNRPQHSGG